MRRGIGGIRECKSSSVGLGATESQRSRSSKGGENGRVGGDFRSSQPTVVNMQGAKSKSAVVQT